MTKQKIIKYWIALLFFIKGTELKFLRKIFPKRKYILDSFPDKFLKIVRLSDKKNLNT